MLNQQTLIIEIIHNYTIVLELVNILVGEQTLVFSMESHKWYKNSASDIYSAPDMNSECIQWNWLFVFCIILCLSLCLFVFRKTLMRHYPTPGDWKGD